MSKNASIPTTVWCRVDQVQLAIEVAQGAGLRITHVGTPERGRAVELAESLGAEPIDDLRAAIASADQGLIWILDPGSFGAHEDDAAALLAAQSRDVKIASLEPVPGNALELTEAWKSGPLGVRAVDTVRVGPLLSRSPVLRVAMENREAFGPIRTLGIELLCRPEQSSLGSQLASVLEFLISEFDSPELIDAAFVGTRNQSGLHETVGESLRGLNGDLSMSLRFGGGRAATVLCSNHAGAWSRSITLLGEGGRTRLDDNGFDWIGPHGEPLDQHRAKPKPPGRSAAAHAMINDLDALCRVDQPATPPIDPGPMLAAALTTLLSCRTGQGENPGSITRLMLG